MEYSEDCIILYRDNIDDIQTFCIKNDIILSYIVKIDASDFYTVCGNELALVKLYGYIDILDNKRKEYRNSKGFLWRLFN